jgi:hypothetical protein
MHDLSPSGTPLSGLSGSAPSRRTLLRGIGGAVALGEIGRAHV